MNASDKAFQKAFTKERDTRASLADPSFRVPVEASAADVEGRPGDPSDACSKHATGEKPAPATPTSGRANASLRIDPAHGHSASTPAVQLSPTVPVTSFVCSVGLASTAPIDQAGLPTNVYATDILGPIDDASTSCGVAQPIVPAKRPPAAIGSEPDVAAASPGVPSPTACGVEPRSRPTCRPSSADERQTPPDAGPRSRDSVGSQGELHARDTAQAGRGAPPPPRPPAVDMESNLTPGGEAQRPGTASQGTVRRECSNRWIERELKPSGRLAGTNPQQPAEAGPIDHGDKAEHPPATPESGATPWVATPTRPATATTVETFHWPDGADRLAQQAATQVEALVESLDAGRHAGRRVVGMTASAAGDGCTTLALCAAKGLARRGRRVALVDADMARPEMAVALGLRPEAGWESCSPARPELAGIVVQSNTESMAVVPCCIARGDARPSNTAPALAGCLRLLADLHDLVLVDLGAIASDTNGSVEVDTELAEQLDGVLIVHNVRSVTTNDLDQLRQRLRQRGLAVAGICENFVA